MTFDLGRITFSRAKNWIIRQFWELTSSAMRGNKLLMKPPAIGAYIDVGCGKNMHQNFYGVDFVWRPGLNLCWDITKGLPIQSNLLGGIYSEHCLEHLSFFDCMAATREFYRKKKPGAALRIVVPDGELYVRKYLSGEEMPNAEALRQSTNYLGKETESKTLTQLKDDFYAPFMVVNQVFYDWGHRYMYDFEILAKILQRAGFRQIEKASYRKGGDPHLLVDNEARAPESLYVIALK